MGKIGSSTLRDWNTGDVMTSDDYEKEREIIRTAINDNDTRIGTVEPQVTNLSSDGADYVGTWHGLTPGEASEEVNGARIDAMQEQNKTTTATFNRGIQSLLLDQGTPLWIKKIVGKTVINHVPLFDSGVWNLHSNVTVDSPTQITLNATSDYDNSTIQIPVKSNTDYTISHGKMDGQYAVTDTAGNYITGMEYGTGTRTFNTGSETAIKIYLSNVLEGSGKAYVFSEIMMNEGSTAQSFVADLKGLEGLYLKSVGKNLVKSFTSWDLHANASIGSHEYELVLNADSTANHSKFEFKVLPSKDYTASLTTNNGYFRVEYYKEDKSLINSTAWNDGLSLSFTTPSDCSFLKITLSNNSVSGSYTFTYPQVELGTTSTTFEEYNEQTLPIEGTWYEGDESYIESGKLWKLADKKDIVLDGSLTWLFSQDYVGYKSIRTPINNGVDNSGLVVKDNGKILRSLSDFNNTTGGDDQELRNGTDLYISISDTDSGWTDSMTPTSDEISAYFNGWTYTNDYNSDATTGDIGWINMYDNTDKTTDINVALSRNTHEENGEVGYKLNYQLADKESVEIMDIDSLSLGTSNHVTLGEGSSSAHVGTMDVTYSENIRTTVDKHTQLISSHGKQLSSLDDNKANKEQEDNIEPILLNGATHSTTNRAGYYKDDMNIVSLKGKIELSTTTDGTIIFMLPMGYRPKDQIYFPVINGKVDILSNGSVRIFGVGTATYVQIDVISFKAEQ